VLGLSVLQTGVGFLATAGTAVLMAAPAQALVTRFGPKLVTVIGLSLLTAGALWYTQIDVDGNYPVDLLPGFLMVGIGIPFSYIPITIAALAGVADRDSGLAAGLLNTSQQVGGAIGVAVISTVSFTHFETLVARGSRPEIALTEGFQWGFWLTAGIWAASLLAAILLIRRMEIPETEEAAAPTAV
jgi:Na+/melibiose symporter-like transporter